MAQVILFYASNLIQGAPVVVLAPTDPKVASDPVPYHVLPNDINIMK